MFLLDADTLIRGDRESYPVRRFPVFYRWLRHMGETGVIKVPIEQFEEVIAGRGAIVDWLNDQDNRDALLHDEELEPQHVDAVIRRGYGVLNEVELIEVGRDPFLIARAALLPLLHVVVTFEISAPGQLRGRRKIPDACRPNGVTTCNLFRMLDMLDFTTDWQP